MKEGNMNRRLMKTLIGCAIISVVSANARAAYDAGYVWNWQNNLPTGNDSNGTRVWYYQYGKVVWNLGDRTQNLHDLDQFVTGNYGGDAAWQINNSVGNFPRIGKIDWNMGLAPSVVKDDSGNVDSHNVVLTWVSPVSGTLHIAGTVRDLSIQQDWQWDGASWWLDKVSQGTASNLASGYVELKQGDSSKATNTLGLDVAVNAGDSISFIVNAGWTQWGDNTAYDVTYTLMPVPEVSSLASLAIGGGLLLAFKKRMHH